MSGRKATGIVGQMLDQTAAQYLAVPLPTVNDPASNGAPVTGEPETSAVPPRRRSRRWERRPENKQFGYRTGSDLHQYALDAVREYRDAGRHTTISNVIRAWALAGREMWLRGELDVSTRSLNAEAAEGMTPRPQPREGQDVV